MKNTNDMENNPPRPFKKQGSTNRNNPIDESDQEDAGVKQDSSTFERDVENEKENDVERTWSDKNEGQSLENKNEDPKIEPGIDDNFKAI